MLTQFFPPPRHWPRPFLSRQSTSVQPAETMKSKKRQSPPRGRSRAAAAAKPRPTTGYVAFIDGLLHTAGPAEHGFPRSKYAVDEAVRLTMAKFPGKNPASVKRIVKVRPRHLERQKVEGGYDGQKKRAPRWKWVGPGHGTGYMHRIDQLLNAGGKTTAEIGEIAAREFGREVKGAVKVVRVRVSHLAKKQGHEPNFIRKAPKHQPPSQRKALRAKNAALLARTQLRGKLHQTQTVRDGQVVTVVAPKAS